MAITLMVIVGGAAIPLAHSSVDRSRAVGAASYVAGRMALARFEAVRRSACVAIRFIAQPDGYWLQSYVDGNRNGVLTRDIALGIDPPITRRRAARLSLFGSRVRYPAQRDGHRSRPIQRERPDSDRQLDAAQLQPDRVVDVRHAVHSRPSGPSVRGPVTRRNGADADPRIQLWRTGVAGTVARERRACAANAGAHDGRDGAGATAPRAHCAHRRCLSGRRAHRNRLAPAARHAGRNAAGRAGAAVSRRRARPSMSCGAARSRAHSVSRRADVRRTASLRGSADPRGRTGRVRDLSRAGTSGCEATTQGVW